MRDISSSTQTTDGSVSVAASAGTDYDLERLFDPNNEHATPECVIQDGEFTRTKTIIDDGLRVLMDRITADARCAFLRHSVPNDTSVVTMHVAGNYRLESCASGGWIIRALSPELAHYWIPCPPKLRTTDEHGRILSEEEVELQRVEFGDRKCAVSIRASLPGDLDIVIWRIPANAAGLLSEITVPSTWETQGYFLYGSHSQYHRPADLYEHLVFGRVHENRRAWPHFWKICDELDAYALYVILSGLEAATGKLIYRLLRRQVLYSVIARQNKDGGWYHGEWTSAMESHYRLHCGAMHLLLNALESQPSPTVRAALDKAAAFLAGCVDQTAIGSWLLHDSLERNVEDMRTSPFRWIASSALGKSVSNMMVLNTHVDGIIALHRYRLLTGTNDYQDLLGSARSATRTIIALRPAETLYRLIFKAIALTWLPEKEASGLPLFTRATKRLTWQKLIPILHRIKARYPRLVMPGGYIDRALTLQGVAHGYQSVNVWDLVRYLRCFPDEPVQADLAQALEFTQHGSLRRLWREPKQRQRHALVFWAEALYHQCMADPDPRYRAWLATAMLDLEELGLGQPPSLLGSNSETVGITARRPCPIPGDSRLRVANLSDGDRYEIVIVNPGTRTSALSWRDELPLELSWRDADGRISSPDTGLVVAPRGWLNGVGSQ